MVARNSEAAEQYLTWALEELGKLGQSKAALHVHTALQELHGTRAGMPNHYADEAKRLRDKADEAEQLVELAKTASRRDALIKIVESYRRTAEQMDCLSKAEKMTKRK